jgi:hypothetical protein
VLSAGQSIQGYITADAAQVDLGAGKHGVIESMAPMATEEPAGKLEPLDLGLSVVAGGFEPERPMIPVRIPKHLSEGVQWANSGMSVTPVSALGVVLGGSERISSGASVLYANTEADTDTVACSAPYMVAAGLSDRAVGGAPRSQLYGISSLCAVATVAGNSPSSANSATRRPILNTAHLALRSADTTI